MKVIHVPAENQNDHRVWFHCPGCDKLHAFSPYQWQFFNWDMEKPTVRESILVRYSDSKGPIVCHSYITDGTIRFEGDCTHSLVGQSVELPDLTDDDLAYFR